MASIHEALRPRGQVVVIDFHRILGKTRVWLLYHVRAGQEVVVKEIESSGFKKVGEEQFLSENYLVRFEKVERKEPRTMLIQPEDLRKKLKEQGWRVFDPRTQPNDPKDTIRGAGWGDSKSGQAAA